MWTFLKSIDVVNITSVLVFQPLGTWDFNSGPGIRNASPALKGCLNHSTSREVPLLRVNRSVNRLKEVRKCPQADWWVMSWGRHVWLRRIPSRPGLPTWVHAYLYAYVGASKGQDQLFVPKKALSSSWSGLSWSPSRAQMSGWGPWKSPLDLPRLRRITGRCSRTSAGRWGDERPLFTAAAPSVCTSQRWLSPPPEDRSHAFLIGVFQPRNRLASCPICGWGCRERERTSALLAADGKKPLSSLLHRRTLFKALTPARVEANGQKLAGWALSFSGSLGWDCFPLCYFSSTLSGRFSVKLCYSNCVCVCVGRI